MAMKGRWARTAVNVGAAVAVFASAFVFFFLTGPSDLAWMEGATYQRRVALTDIDDGPWARPLFVFLSQPFLLAPLGKISSGANLASAALRRRRLPLRLFALENAAADGARSSSPGGSECSPLFLSRCPTRSGCGR